MRRRRAALLAVFLLLAAAPTLRAGDEPPQDAEKEVRQRLNQAEVLETVRGDSTAALEIYEDLIKQPTFADLAADLRADAYLGAARCNAEAGNDDAAARYWEAIRKDQALPDKARTWAREQLEKRASKPTSESGGAEAAQKIAARLRAESAAERMRRAQSFVAEARAAFAGGRYKEALQLSLKALSFDETNEEALALQREIEARRPDLGALITDLIQFFRAQELAEYETLRGRVRSLEALGRDAVNQKDWQAADRHLRDAIRLLDESGFLTLGGAIDTQSLDASRTSLVAWLRQAREKAAAEGLTLEPEPPLPDLEARRGGLQQQFFSIAAQIFTPRERGDAPLNFYKFAPVYKQGAAAKRELDRIFFDVTATHRKGTLTRAYWAERWIRENIGVRWVDPQEEGPASTDRRVLVRLGDLICAQSRPAEHARIEKLRGAFARTPPPLSVSVHVFAVSGAGAVKAVEALRVRAGPRRSGLDHVATGRLVAECAEAIDGLKIEGQAAVVQLGHARISLDGETSVLMELTRMTAEHPAYRTLSPPPLSVPDEFARYGLWLDLYAEDMPERARLGNDRSALAVRARVTQPADNVPSHSVPRTSGKDMPYTRLPLLTEVVRTANRAVPHYGALVLQGLPNPFPATRASLGELLVLIGTTRRDTPIPDPPRVQPSPRIDPVDSRTRDYPLGALSVEVQDDILPEDWPRLRSASEGLSGIERRRRRDLYLADILMQMANLDPEAPGGRDALQVQDHRAIATLSPDEHLRLDRAVVRMNARENDLYRATVVAAVVDKPLWRNWTKLPGMKANANGNLVAQGEGLAIVRKELTALAERGGLFNTRGDLPLRATQLRAYTNLNVRRITKDLHVRLLTRGRQRYTPVWGLAEEGLIVEVRPGLEVQGQAGGFRSVRVRVRAAHLDRIEARAYPGATLEAAVYDVPVWHTGTNGTFSQRRDAEILKDEEALLLPVGLPGVEDKVILVLLTVQRVQ